MKTESEFEVEYQEAGNGDAIVFVPGSFSTGSSWRPIATPLSERYRTITTSLSGYGKTQERRTPGGKHMEDQIDVLEAVLKKVDAPVHLVAHSFGAYCALLLAIRRPCKLLSLTFFEPTVFGLLALSDEAALNQEVLNLLSRYTMEWDSGHKTAVRHIIDFYGGEGTFSGYPDPVKDKLVSMTETNILDWRSGFADPVTLEEISSLDIPVSLVCGSNSHMAMRRSNQLLCAGLPDAKLTILEGANHFMIGTHAPTLIAIIDENVGRRYETTA